LCLEGLMRLEERADVGYVKVLVLGSPEEILLHQ
jgi:hypothetical protein